MTLRINISEQNHNPIKDKKNLIKFVSITFLLYASPFQVSRTFIANFKNELK